MSTCLYENLVFLIDKNPSAEADLRESLGMELGTLRNWPHVAAPFSAEGLIRVAEYFNLPIDTLVRVPLFNQTPEVTVHGDIALLALDVDGTLTDGGLYISESGEELKRFHSRDSLAIRRLVRSGVQVAFISNGPNPRLLEAMAAQLGVQLVHAGPGRKAEIVAGWLAGLGLAWHQVAYVGDDVNDLETMALCQLTACPADAAWQMKTKVGHVLATPGGKGCVREFIELFLLPID